MASEVKVKNVENTQDFTSISESIKEGIIVAHFWASWAPQCQQVDDVLVELSKDSMVQGKLCIVRVEAEVIPELSMKFNIKAVPTCLILKSGKEVGRVNGIDVGSLTALVQQWCSQPNTTTASSGPKAPKIKSLKERLEQLTKAAPCMVFMKGEPGAPQCGFSKQLVALFNEHKVDYSTFDILSDEDVRQGLKEYSDWPTFPQVYVKGEFIGGLDIVKQMSADGELDSAVPHKEDLNDRLKKLINKAPVMIFMKGHPSEPKCGFSKQLVAIMSETEVPYETFDILTDEKVRQGLKTFSNWPTYPQVYVKGEFIGGLDIIRELKEGDELKATLTAQ